MLVNLIEIFLSHKGEEISSKETINNKENATSILWQKKWTRRNENPGLIQMDKTSNPPRIDFNV